MHDSKFSSQLRVYYIDRGRLPFLLLKGPLSLKIISPHAFADSLSLSSFRAMFKFFCIAVLALALRVSGLVVPRQTPPAGWTSELEVRLSIVQSLFQVSSGFARTTVNTIVITSSFVVGNKILIKLCSSLYGSSVREQAWFSILCGLLSSLACESVQHFRLVDFMLLDKMIVHTNSAEGSQAVLRSRFHPVYCG